MGGLLQNSGHLLQNLRRLLQYPQFWAAMGVLQQCSNAAGRSLSVIGNLLYDYYYYYVHSPRGYYYRCCICCKTGNKYLTSVLGSTDWRLKWTITSKVR